ncbi:MAG: glycoside hydrolase family 2, partial [Chitinophagaceae bacterium]
LWNEYQWPVQREPADRSLVIDQQKIVNLNDRYYGDSFINWDVPAGDWTIIHYGMMPTGVTNSPASPEGQGLEIDKINDAAMQHHFDSFVGKIQQSIPVSERTSLKWVVADSYETGSQNWTDGMLNIFRDRYHYDPLPWLPVLTGRIVQSADRSDRFLWDLRRLVADRVAEKYVGGLKKISNKNGLKIWLENYGHWGFPSEFLKYGGASDEIGGEFWNEGTLGNIECRAASSAAHIYGKTKVAAESFTAGGAAFARYPAMLKKRGDWSFTEGINHTLFHVFISQPYENRNPGVNTWFGTEFNRKNTWFYQGKAFMDYIRRCNYLLQQGLPVNDVAYFIGEDAPKMTGTRDPELPVGYSYDYINEEVLMERASVANGKLVLPDGMSYRVLVLPKLETMRPELLAKITSMVNAGLCVYGPAPKRSPSMENYPAADQQVKTLATKAWGNEAKDIVRFGKGKIYNNMGLDSVFSSIGLKPDFRGHQHVLYTHRKDKEEEIYFISNQSDTTIRFNASFRVKNKQPEWWDAVDGSSRVLKDFELMEGNTIIPMQLEPLQSGFVIFRKPISSVASGNALTNYNRSKTQPGNFPQAVEVVSFKNPWIVTFDTAFNGPLAPVRMDTLIDWKDSRDPSIKNYSGTAIYKTTIDVHSINGAGSHLYLNTGKVGVMAIVRINGQPAGSVWTAPYKVDVTPFIKKGVNQVEIEVVNTWVNRLIGDSKLPPGERKTWLNVNNYNPQSEYQSSGVAGPVTLETIVY